MTTQGPGEDLIAVADVAEVMAAIEALDLGAPWGDVAPDLRLALPRRRPLPPGTDDLPSQVYAPGITAVLALDIGPALLFVRREQLAAWGVSADHAFRRARANVQDRVARRRPVALVHEWICGTPALAFHSREGWAATLLLLPDLLCGVLGDRDGIILAPMRDLVIRLPLDADPELVTKILEEFARADLNALDLPPFALVDGRLSHLVSHPRALRRGPAVQ